MARDNGHPHPGTITYGMFDTRQLADVEDTMINKLAWE